MLRYTTILIIFLIAITSVNSEEKISRYSPKLYLTGENVTACSNFSKAEDCRKCMKQPHCVWCNDKGDDEPECVERDIAYSNDYTCKSGLCNGESCAYICDCGNPQYPCAKTILGMLILMAFYGVVLSFGAKLISDGAEGMLDLFPKYGTVIGALLLPVLGAVPDAAMIVVSGAFGKVAEAQVQVAVGVGTLAGSTIMLLTVPWTASLFVAACDFDEFGEAIDKKRTSWHPSKVGITVDEDTPLNARIMLITSISYWIVQGVAFAHVHDPSGDTAKKIEKPLAITGFIVCTIFLVAYCIYQVFVPKLAQRRQEKREEERKKRNEKLRALYILKNFPSTFSSLSVEDDENALTLEYAKKWKKIALKSKGEEYTTLIENKIEVEDEEEDEEDESPEGSFGKNLGIAIFQLIMGTVVVALFSDPMVDVISTFGATINISPFFVSFILTPFCSNASELIASLAFASHKRQKNTSLTYSQLYGAASMNNTLGLGIFYALIAFRGLYWNFSSETMAILFVTIVMGAITSFKRSFSLWWAIPNVALYPLSLILVSLLDNKAHWT